MSFVRWDLISKQIFFVHPERIFCFERTKKLKAPFIIIFVPAYNINHQSEKRRLRAGKIINTVPVWYKVIFFQQERKIQNHVLSRFYFSVCKQPKNCKEAVPVIYLSEPAPRDYIIMFKR